MSTAQYGRMKIGSCVKKDLGYIGCFSDVLALADSRCSGRQSCQIRIPDPEFDQTRPCLEELKTYLEASYHCIQVDKPFGTTCEGEKDPPWSITRSARSGYLSSGVAIDTRCGTEHSPIRINAWPGQRLNITVYDFRHGSSAQQQLVAAQGSPHFGSIPEPDCNHFAILYDQDVRRRIKVCPGIRRIRNVYVTNNRSVDVYFKRVGPTVDEERFLIQYTVLGCADIRPAEDMWVSRSENEADIGCRQAEQKWRLICVDNRWEGVVGNCSQSYPLGVTVLNDGEATLTHGVAIAVILCVALLMGVIVLVLGALGLILRRFHRRSSRDSGMFAPDAKTPPPEYCDRMCSIEPEIPDVDVDCKYVEHRCAGCQESVNNRQNNYAPIRLGTAHAPPEMFNSLPVGYGQGKAGRFSVLSRTCGGGNELPVETKLCAGESFTTALTSGGGGGAGGDSSSLDYDLPCSCSNTDRFTDREGGAKFTFWKSQRKLTYCPVFSGHCPQPNSTGTA